jgi:hypothetical protein
MRWLVFSLRLLALLMIPASSVWPILIAIGVVCFALSLVLEHYLTRNQVPVSGKRARSKTIPLSEQTARYQAELEQILTAELREKQGGISLVRLSADGQFAIYNVGDRYTLRRLSPAAREFLNHGDTARLREEALFQ